MSKENGLKCIRGKTFIQYNTSNWSEILMKVDIGVSCFVIPRNDHSKESTGSLFNTIK